MVNLRVDDCDRFVADLRAKTVTVLDEVDKDYSNFAWRLDPDGVKIEL